MIRYANDLPLTELAMQIKQVVENLNHDLRDGYLNSAFLRAENLGVKLEKFKERLNDIKYGRAK